MVQATKNRIKKFYKGISFFVGMVVAFFLTPFSGSNSLLSNLSQKGELLTISPAHADVPVVPPTGDGCGGDGGGGDGGGGDGCGGDGGGGGDCSGCCGGDGCGGSY